MANRAIIIGAGPAGLTAAYELLKRTDIKPVILEKTGDIGGISKTVNYKGNRIDIGGHRFFSKSDRVMEWWLQFLPLPEALQEQTIYYRHQSRKLGQAGHAAAPADQDKVMLIRPRLSRIYFLRQFFDYPLRLSADTLRKLGFMTTMRVLLSYLKARLLPRPAPVTLEDFFISRFGEHLYRIFFKDYTEKVWGVPCDRISAEWGAQRIKGVSISKALGHAARSMVRRKNGDIAQKDVETSQIERFMYPKFGPGQLWEEVARQVVEMGGEIHFHQDVRKIKVEDNAISCIEAYDSGKGTDTVFRGDYFFSTMPVSELVAGMEEKAPEEVRQVAAGLQYRDFITVGVLLKQLSEPGKKPGEFHPRFLKDTWIYVQEKNVKVGRLQLFNNWSPFLVKDPTTTWLGMEYFCSKGDGFWELPDDAIRQLGIEELEKMQLARQEDVLDTVVIRMEKTYPAYFGSYDRFDRVREYMDGLRNLFLIGRNGMHKYNNSDHSMLTAMVAVDNICHAVTDRTNIWAINTEQEYHEEDTSRK